MALLPLLLLSTPTSASKPAKDLYASYRPMERFQPTGEFTVSVLRGKEWKEAGRVEFDRFYRERRIDLSRFVPAGEAATVRIVQKGGGAAHVDAATLGGAAPSSIRGSGDPLVKSKLSKADFDVVDAFGKTLELSFPLNSRDRTLSLVARVEGEQRVGIPFLFPPENHGKPVDRIPSFYSYLPGSGTPATLKNGRLDDRAKPFFREWSLSASGHPSSWTYGWVGSDEKNLYVRIDFTGDDTRDGGADYTSVHVKGKDGVREFKLSETDTRWGKPSFAYTSKVPWQHKVYDFTIPWKETGAVPGKPVELAFSAYGTEAGFQQGVYETAAAYDSVNNRYLVVYTRYTGLGNNFDIYGQLVGADGTFLGAEFGIVTNSWNNRNPAVAFDPVNRQYLVVFEDDGDGDGIFGRLLDETGTFVDAVNVAYSPAASSKQFPSVAFNGRNRTYLVAWQDNRPPASGTDYDIWGQIISESGTPMGADFPISTAANTQENASVSANDADGTFLVVFDDTRPPFASVDVYGQLVLDDGSLVGTLDNVNLVVSNNAFNQRLPRASFDPVTKRFLAVWQDYRNGGLPDVYGQFLDNTGATVLSGSTVNLPVSTNVDDQDPPVIVHSGPAGAYLTAWHDDRDMSAFSIYGQILLNDGTLFGSTAPENLPLVPAADNAVTLVYPPGIAANSSVPQALLSFAADPSPFDQSVGERLGVRILGAPPLPGGALQVVTTIPDNNATGVPVGTTVSALFNLAIDQSSVPGNFQVVRTSDSSVVAGAFSFSADNTAVIFTPSAALDNNTNYTVTVFNDGITQQGDSGNFLQNDYIFNFTTASASNSVILFFRNTPSIFGCAVAPGKVSWKEGAGALLLFVLPALVLFARRHRGSGNGGHRALFRGFFLLLLAAAMILAASAPSDAGPLGPPQPSVKAGQFGGAIGYFYTEDKWEPDTSTSQSGGTTVIWETDKVKQNSVFLRGAYGFSTNCEASVKVGIADRGAPQGFEDSYGFFAGVGAKGILYATPSFSVGPILDFTWYSDYEDNIAFSQGGTTWTGKEKIEDSWDLHVGIGIQAPVGKGTVYGGPSFFWNRADVTYQITNGVVTLNVDNEYNQKNAFGGFAGVRYPVTDRIGIEVEGQYRSGFSAGATILYAF